MNLNDSVKTLKGVGDKKAALLEKVNIKTLNQLLGYFPRTYQDRTNIKKIKELVDGEEALITGIVTGMQLTGKNYRRPTLRLLVDDGSGLMEIIFFNGRWLKSSFKIGVNYTFFGKAEVKNGKKLHAPS